VHIPSRIVVGVLLVFVGLLVLVIVVGLIRDQVDTNGLILVLTPVISGLLVGGAIRSNRGSGSDGGSGGTE
jgi:hypothetical protein